MLYCCIRYNCNSSTTKDENPIQYLHTINDIINKVYTSLEGFQPYNRGITVAYLLVLLLHNSVASSVDET